MKNDLLEQLQTMQVKPEDIKGDIELSQTDRHKVISDLNEWERVKRDLK